MGGNLETGTENYDYDKVIITKNKMVLENKTNKKIHEKINFCK